MKLSTVGEVIRFLSKFDEQLPIRFPIMYEAVRGQIETEYCKVANDPWRHGVNENLDEVVVIDVE